MNDAILLSLSTEAFEDVVKEALKSLRRNAWLDLAASDLAHCSLVEQCFFVGEERTDVLRGRLLRTVLHWAIDQLRRDGEHSWVDKEWRTYNLLSAIYLERITWANLADRMGVDEDTPYKRFQGLAIAALAKFLRNALAGRQGLNERERYALAARLALLSNQEPWVLGLVALCRLPIPMEFFDEVGLSKEVAGLLAAGLLRRTEDGALELPPALRAALLERLTPDERRAGHEHLARYYEARLDYLEAAYHYRGMGKSGILQAAEFLLTHQESIRSQDRLEELAKALAAFKKFEVSKEQWCRLKLLAGDVALATKNVKRAIEEYRKALDAPDVSTRIRANHRLAEALVRGVGSDEAAAHYDEAIRLLETSQSDPELLAQVYIDRAWFSIQVRSDPSEAEYYLNLVEPKGDCRIEALLHNAWAGLLAHRTPVSPQEVIKRRVAALRAANESQQRELRLKMAKNLAFDYAELLKDYDKALLYLQQALALSREMGDRELEAICLKDVGSCHFWRKDYRAAIQLYEEAYHLLVKLGNENWLAAVCLEMAEAYAELGEVAQARRYFEEGKALADKLRHERYLEEAERLRRRYAAILATGLTRRQERSMEYVRTHGFITNKICRTLTTPHTSKATATRDLDDLCERGLLVMVEKGRATRYCLPPDDAATPVPTP